MNCNTQVVGEGYGEWETIKTVRQVIGYQLQICGVLFVLLPLGRVGLDIFTNSIQFLFISDDVIVIIPLPDRVARQLAVNIYFLCGYGFESGDEGTQ